MCSGVASMQVNTSEVIIFVDGGEKSKKLIKEIKNKNNGSSKIKIINVDEKKIRGWIYLEYGTLDVPLMVTPTEIVEGYDNIKKAITSMLS